MSEATAVASDAPITDDWVDVHLSDPEEGEWDLDTIVVGGDVEYVNIRVRRNLVASFVDCLLDDVPPAQARSIVTGLAETYGNDDAPSSED